MAKLTYAEQIKHPKWQKKRLEVLEAADWKCEKCGETEKQFHVHHKKYVRGRMAWEYERSELQALCEDCHGDEHSMQDYLDHLLAVEWSDKDMDGREIVVGFLTGFLAPFTKGDPVIDKITARAIEGRWPFFDIGFLLAALGPDDLIEAVRRKRAEGRLPDVPLIAVLLGEEVKGD